MARSNRWNLFIYRLWSPFYDWFIEAGFIVRARREAIDMLQLRPGAHVLLVGIGTGADLPRLPARIAVAGLDLSPAMLARARKKLAGGGPRTVLLVGDALHLPFADDSFDAVILTLILSVVPDPRRCLDEARRVARSDGRLLVFDKFLPDHREPSRARRLLNLLTDAFGTDINRRFGDMSEGLGLAVVEDRPSLFRGAYRAILLKKS
jgi:phosphatidylethanolamine/phosphatidyl-N-methylethanolamine N-methyltransferase